MRQIASFALLLVLSATAVSTAANTLYKTVGPDGTVTYSDQPPADASKTNILNYDDLPITVLPPFGSSNTDPTLVERARKLWDSWSWTTTKTKAPSSGVVLYTTRSCGYCKQAKAYLEGKGIKYQEIDVETKSGNAQYAQAGGGKGVPMIVVAGKNVNGFSPAAYDALFAK
jgi:glutaredoxin